MVKKNILFPSKNCQPIRFYYKSQPNYFIFKEKVARMGERKRERKNSACMFQAKWCAFKLFVHETYVYIHVRTLTRRHWKGTFL